MTEEYDVIVIGGGPGGYPAAIRAAQRGARVALVEKHRLGGECTNYGCIPTKALLSIASSYLRLRRLGFIREDKPDYTVLYSFIDSVVSEVSSGIRTLLRSYGVDIIESEAVLDRDGSVRLVDGRVLRSKTIVLAPGSEPARLNIAPVDGELVHDNRSVFKLIKRPPSSILVIGGGYVGLEFAYAFASLGVDVTVVEALERVLPGLDADLSRVVARSLRRMGIRIHTSKLVKEVTSEGASLRVRLSTGEELGVDAILVAVGRVPATKGLELERAGVKLDERGFIVVDDLLATSNPRVYASGDATGPPMLAHKAMFQAIIAGENASGGNIHYNPGSIPSVVFTEPEVVSVGMTLQEARDRGLDAVEARYPVGGAPKAIIERVRDGVVKIVYERVKRRILGIHIAAPGAAELAGEAAVAVDRGMTLDELAEVIHPHPTISESIVEAIELALGRPRHYALRIRR